MKQNVIYKQNTHNIKVVRLEDDQANEAMFRTREILHPSNRSNPSKCISKILYTQFHNILNF